ncbi:MAG: hypothetical protein NVSMB9_10690 [Isosphaeraceae bacterium]
MQSVSSALGLQFARIRDFFAWQSTVRSQFGDTVPLSREQLRQAAWGWAMNWNGCRKRGSFA